MKEFVSRYQYCLITRNNRFLDTQRHLVKCAKNHPDSKVEVCPFNSCHRVVGEAMGQHLRECPDRGQVEHWLAGGREERLVRETSREQTRKESWEDDLIKTSYDPSKNASSRKVLRKVEGVTPSQRRFFRIEENNRLKKMGFREAGAPLETVGDEEQGNLVDTSKRINRTAEWVHKESFSNTSSVFEDVEELDRSVSFSDVEESGERPVAVDKSVTKSVEVDAPAVGGAGTKGSQEGGRKVGGRGVKVGGNSIGTVGKGVGSSSGAVARGVEVGGGSGRTGGRGRTVILRRDGMIGVGRGSVVVRLAGGRGAVRKVEKLGVGRREENEQEGRVEPGASIGCERIKTTEGRGRAKQVKKHANVK